MTTGTILYCFILVAVIFFIQWMIIGWCLYEINKRFDEEKKVQEIRRMYQNNEFTDLECSLDGIECNLDNIDEKLKKVLDFIERYDHKTYEGD